MTELVATTTGLFPLPDWAKSELADLKGHQKDDLVSGDEPPVVVEQYDRARAEVVARQQKAGLDRIVEGQLRWDDMLAHPLAVHDSVETHGIVRYYDNNNFYREPVVTGDLSPTGDLAADLKKADVPSEELQAVVPGPYTLADLATDDHYGDSTERNSTGNRASPGDDFLDAITEFLVGEIEQFPDHATLLVLEPSLVEEPPGDGDSADRSSADSRVKPGDDERAGEAIDRVVSASDAESIVYPFYGALSEKMHAHLLDTDVDAMGYDFVTDHDDNLYNINEYGTTDSVALGFVEGQNTNVESPDLLRQRVEWVEENTPAATFERAFVLPNTETFYLPTERFEAKLDALGALTRPEEATT